MTILLIGCLIGFICAIAGAKKAGFVSGWATLLNASVSMYLAAYITPTLVASIPIASEYTFGPVLLALIIAILAFAILNTIYSAVTGDLKIAMPRLVETLGGGVLGFLNGLLLWGFLCLLLEMSPLMNSSLVKETCRDPQEIRQMWSSSVGTSMAVLNAASCQDSPAPLGKVVDAMKAVANPKPKPKPRPTPAQDNVETTEEPNSTGDASAG
jgi:hypothetical protein